LFVVAATIVCHCHFQVMLLPWLLLLLFCVVVICCCYCNHLPLLLAIDAIVFIVAATTLLVWLLDESQQKSFFVITKVIWFACNASTIMFFFSKNILQDSLLYGTFLCHITIMVMMTTKMFINHTFCTVLQSTLLLLHYQAKD